MWKKEKKKEKMRKKYKKREEKKYLYCILAATVLQ